MEVNSAFSVLQGLCKLLYLLSHISQHCACKNNHPVYTIDNCKEIGAYTIIQSRRASSFDVLRSLRGEILKE